MSKTFRAATAMALALMLPIGYAHAETADEFVARINKEFADIWLEGNAAGWTQATYINVDTELLNARATERWLAAFGKAVEEAKAFDGQPMTPASKRAIERLKQGVPAPAPDDPAKRAEAAFRFGTEGQSDDGGVTALDEFRRWLVSLNVVGQPERQRRRIAYDFA